MAVGYARTTGYSGVCMVVPGQGLLNAKAELATPWGNRSASVVLECLRACSGTLHDETLKAINLPDCKSRIIALG